MTKEFTKKMEETFESFLKNREFSDNFVAGAVFGIKWFVNNIWHNASDPHDERKLLIVKLINGQVALYKGSFNNAGRDFGICEAVEHGSEPKGIIEKWCYLDDILPDSK